MKSKHVQGTLSEKSQNYRLIDFQNSNSTSAFIKNRIYSSQYTFFSVIPKTLLREFQKISFFWFVFLIILNQSMPPPSFGSKWCVLIIFGFLVSGIIIKNYISYFLKIFSDETINNSAVHIWNKTGFIESLSKKIKVGEIILVKNNEVVPADIILLACSNQEKACCIDIESVIGGNKIVIKRALNQTQMQNGLENSQIVHISKLIENIKVIPPCKSFTKFKGKIKFKENPKSQPLDIHSFIVGGSKIAGNDWVLGVVVYTGMESKIWINSKKNKLLGLTKFEKIINKVHLVNFFIICSLVFISTLVNVYSSKFVLYNNIGNIISNYFVLFSNLIPVSLFLCLTVCKFIEILRAKLWKRNISIINPSALEDLGKVEYVLVEKSILLENKDPIVNILMIGDQILLENINEVHDENDYKPMSSTFSKFLPNDFVSYEEFYDKISRNEITDREWKFLQAMCLCYNPPINKILHFEGADEKALANTLAKFGVSFKQVTKDLCSITCNEKVFDYQILDEYTFNSLSPNSKILVKSLTTNKILFFVKGNYEIINPLISDENDRNFIEETIKSEIGFIIKTVLFVYKELKNEEALKFINDLQIAKLSHIDVDKKIKAVYKNIEKDLKYLGIAGLEYMICEENIKTIKTLNNAGIKTWIVTGDDEENTLIASHASGIIIKSSEVISLSKFSTSSECLKAMKIILNHEVNNDNNMQYYHLANKNPYLIRLVKHSKQQKNSYRTKTILKKLMKTKISLRDSKNTESSASLLIPKLIKKEYNFSLSIDPQALDFALSSPYHRKVFSQLLFLAKSVCFHSLNPDQKINITKFLKNNFSFKPTVLAIGDTAIGMLDEASIGISIQKSKKIINFTPEIEISNFSDLSELILSYGHYSYIRFSKILLYTIYKETMVCTILFLYQYRCDYSGTSLIDLDLLIIFEFVISFIPIVVIGSFEKDVNEESISSSSTLYSTGFFNLDLSSKKIIFYHIIGGVIIFILLEYGYGQIVNSLGFTENSDIKGILGFVLISLSIINEIFLGTRRIISLTVLSPFITVGCMSLIIELTYSNDITQYSLSRHILLSQSTFWFILMVLPLISTILYYFFYSIFENFRKFNFFTRIEMFQQCFDKIYIETDDWPNESTKNSLEFNRKTLKFESELKELQYQQNFNNSLRSPLQILIGLISLGILLYTILLYSKVIPQLSYETYAFIPLVFSLGFFLWSFNKKLHWVKFSFMFFAFILTIFVIRSNWSDSITSFYYPLIEIFFSVSFSMSWKNSAFQVLATFIVSLIVTMIENYNIDYVAQPILSCYFIITNAVICGLAVSISYILELNSRKQFMYLKRIEYELEHFNSILSLLLPEFVRKRVKDGVRYIAEDKGVVSVIFCDIYEFDKIIEDYKPNELISFLDEVFEKLDKLCDSIGVTKIETVGKTYLACAGLKDSEFEMNLSVSSISHAKRAVDFGLAILNESSQITLKNGEHLKFKIGINSGPVTAGVVGLHKPQFSLVGDTVNTASRMASTLTEPHAIQISLESFSLLENSSDLTFIPKFPEVKGKGIMKTMIVSKTLKSNLIPSLEEFSFLDTSFHVADILIINTMNLNVNNPHYEAVSRLNLPKQILRRIQIDINKRKEAERWNLFRNVCCYEDKEEKAFQLKLKEL